MGLASIKSTRRMAIEFSRAYFSAAADVGRLLGSIGLELHAEQTAADEFDYSLSTAEVRLTSSDYSMNWRKSLTTPSLPRRYA